MFAAEKSGDFFRIRSTTKVAAEWNHKEDFNQTSKSDNICFCTAWDLNLGAKRDGCGTSQCEPPAKDRPVSTVFAQKLYHTRDRFESKRSFVFPGGAVHSIGLHFLKIVVWSSMWKRAFALVSERFQKRLKQDFLIFKTDKGQNRNPVPYGCCFPYRTHYAKQAMANDLPSPVLLIAIRLKVWK